MSDINVTKAMLIASDSEAMHQIGGIIGRRLFPGAFIAMFGGLGAGKTTLTKGIASALGIKEIVSPTFTIVRSYHGSLDLDHFDAYRIAAVDDLTAIGYWDYVFSLSVIVMEWCENVPDALPPTRLELHIEGSGDDIRTIKAVAYGDAYKAIMEEL